MKTLCIIVNYKSAGLTIKAAQSVLDCAGHNGSTGPVHVVIVDNSADDKEAAALKNGLPPGVTLLVNPKNIGFGRACNLAFEHFEGDLILLINPDARLLPGALPQMQETLLSCKRVAAVSPKIYWDDGQRFLLPPACPPWVFVALAGSCGDGVLLRRLLSCLWRRYSLRVWRSKKAVRVFGLSGGVALLKSEAVRRAGGLFDPAFFLYFEDADLFLRLRKAGYIFLAEPRAKAVHHYDQCGQEEWQWKRSLMEGSAKIFLEKHGKGLGLTLAKAVGRLDGALFPDRSKIPEIKFMSPFVLEVPVSLHEGWLFEWSPDPNFIPAAGRFGKGEFMDFPAECWAMLAPGRYFGRLCSPRGLGIATEEISWEVRE